MGERLQNTCSWSSSREGTFLECKKKYWYSYYGAWEGWPLHYKDSRTSVDPLAHYLYRLKNMQSLPIFIGSLVHKVIENLLRTLMKSKKLPSFSFVLEEGKFLLQKGLHESKEKLYLKNPKKHANLLEDYYKREKASVGELESKIETCLFNWYHSPIIQSMILHPAASLGDVEQLMRFSIAPAMECIVVFDLSLYWKRGTSGEKLIIFDWKTGAENSRIMKQMLSYALAATHALHAPLSSLILCPFYMSESPHAYKKMGVGQPVPFAEGELEETKASIMNSLSSMQAMHTDNPLPAPQHFPYTEERKACFNCPFQEVCLKVGYQEKTSEELRLACY